LHDLTTSAAEKIEKSGRPDDSFEAVLRGEMEKVGWMCCPLMEDRSDALASPYFADKASLPDHVFMIACEKGYRIQRQSSCAGAWLWRKGVKLSIGSPCVDQENSCED